MFSAAATRAHLVLATMPSSAQPIKIARLVRIVPWAPAIWSESPASTFACLPSVQAESAAVKQHFAESVTVLQLARTRFVGILVRMVVAVHVDLCARQDRQAATMTQI